MTLRPFATSCAKDYKRHSLVQTSFTEPPNRSHHMLPGAPISTSPTKPTAPCADSAETIKSDGNMSKEQEIKYSSDQVWSMPHQPGTHTPIIAFRHLLKEGCRKPVLGVCLGPSLCQEHQRPRGCPEEVGKRDNLIQSLFDTA